MKRKIVSMLLVTALTVSTLAGCGGNDAAGDSGSDASGTPAESGTAADGSGTAVEDTAEAADTAEKTDSGQASGGEYGDYVFQELEDAEITYYTFSIEGKELCEQEIAAYNEIHPNIKINLNVVGGGTDWRATLKAQISSGEAPDIIMVEGSKDFDTFGDMLEDLSDQPVVEHIYPNVIEDCKIDGKVIGIPGGVVCYGMLYNKAIFEACGIDGSTLNTYEAIDSAFATVKAAIESGELADQFPNLEGVVSLPGAEKWVIGQHAGNAAMAMELKSANEAFKAQTFDFTYGDQMKDYIDLMVKYTPEADNPATLVAVDYDSAMGGSFCIEKTAVIQMGQWVQPVISEIDPELLDKIGVLPIPMKGVDEDNICYGIAAYMIVNKNSSDANKAAAKDFINWLYMSDEGKEMVTSSISVPMDNFDGFPSANVISQECEAYAKAGNTTTLVFSSTPDGWLDLLGAGVQSYISGDKEWSEVAEEARTNWSELRQK